MVGCQIGSGNGAQIRLMFDTKPSHTPSIWPFKLLYTELFCSYLPYKISFHHLLLLSIKCGKLGHFYHILPLGQDKIILVTYLGQCQADYCHSILCHSLLSVSTPSLSSALMIKHSAERKQALNKMSSSCQGKKTGKSNYV